MLFEKGSSEQQLLTEMKWPIDFFLPIVVFDGGIWRWDKRAERIDQVLLQVSLTSPNYVAPYPFVCIVNKHWFFELVEQIEEDLWKIADMIHDNVHSLNQQRTIIEEGIMGMLK